MGFFYIEAKKISHESMQRIFDTFTDLIKLVDFEKTGYKYDNNIYFDGKSKMLCRAEYASYALGQDIGVDSFKHVIFTLNEDQSDPIKNDITGMLAYAKLMTILRQSYTKEEIVNILSSYTDVYDEGLKQWHYNEFEIGEISEFDNVVKYDINGAHADALVEMFPKAESDLRELYAKRKEEGMEEVKSYFNYTVGMFKHKGYEGAYNHIVQRTTKKLIDFYDKIGGIIVYINTDGIAVNNPKIKVPSGKELGEFKIEYEGKAYTYGGNGYFVVQWGDKDAECKCLKGSNCLKAVRPLIDLSKGKLVKYKKVLNKFGLYEAKEVKEVEYEKK